MTDRAKRWSNICGIATKSWPASDFNAPSAATDRLLLEPSLRAIRLYIGFVAPPPRKKHGRGACRSGLPGGPSYVIGRSADLFATGAQSAQKGSLTYTPPEGPSNDHQGWRQDTIGDSEAGYPRGTQGDHHRRVLRRQEGRPVRGARRLYASLLAAPLAGLRRQGVGHQGKGGRRGRLCRGRRCRGHGRLGQGAEDRRQGQYAGRRQRRFRAGSRARARPQQERPRDPLEALFDVGRQWRRQVAQRRSAARPSRHLQRRDDAEGALSLATALPFSPNAEPSSAGGGATGDPIASTRFDDTGARQSARPFVLGMAGVTAHPLPADLVACRGCIEPLPKIDVLDRLFVGGAPTAFLPAVNPFGDAIAQILAVAVEPDTAWPL